MRSVIKFILYFFAAFLFNSTAWINNNFGSPTIDQIFFQILLIPKTINAIPSTIIESYLDIIKYSLLFALCITSIDCVFAITRTKIETINSKTFILIKKLDHFILSKLSIWMFMFSLSYFLISFSIIPYIQEQHKKAPLYQNYVDPRSVQISPTNPKNLILIYMESIEDTHQDKEIFGKDLLASLDNIGGISFKNYKHSSHTQWTIAAQFSTQCGIPIDTDYINYNNLCLSDILAKNNYHNVYMQGASLDFTNTGKFLKKHQYHELYGKQEWKEIGFTNFNEWGLYDDDLFAQAKLKLKELHTKQQLFNLTILTLDTHEPYGYISNYCKENNVSNYTDIVECSANQVADFIDFIIDNGYLKDTNIVIIGDHLFSKDSIFNNIPKYDRAIFNLFISNDVIKTKREEIIPFDLFPTILNFIGFKVEGERLGIGESGFSNKTAESLKFSK